MCHKWVIVKLLLDEAQEKPRMTNCIFEVRFQPYYKAPALTVGCYLVEAEARNAVAHYLKSHRRCGYPVCLVEAGMEWQINQPKTIRFMPPECGSLLLIMLDTSSSEHVFQVSKAVETSFL